MDKLPPKLIDLLAKTERVAKQHMAPLAEQVDRDCAWPEHSMKALAEEGLLGLLVPEEFGGHGQGLLGLSLLTELMGRVCPSSALCFGMHCVGTAVIAAKATKYQQDHYLRPIARGEHITTLALAEGGTGAHFYLPETRFLASENDFVLNGTKQFITSGGYADSYVVSTAPAEEQAETGDFSCLIVDHDTRGMQWLEPWTGFGMRGNSSRGLRFTNAHVPQVNLLGEAGDQVWYVFEVVAPYFLMAMAGTYLGVARSAVDAASEHLRTRRHSHSGELLAEVESLQTRFAEMWVAVEKTRSLIHEAAYRGDLGRPDALPFILACKADAGETAVRLTNDAMTICGGHAYRENSRVAQMLRDARASHVMAPTTDILRTWTGRALLGLPLL
ncbi:acyl-CoA dehydrogenase family protein [Marinobacter fonticola]|uniref:acyl-CoA dehydrogenase family protein n=1 Tax=Marinobacter fonticola TaxID=2603215 RepID=UPI0011E6E4A8|nr:acyl-CoA dehydrogenase family protein [Marinobacter fonticola]